MLCDFGGSTGYFLEDLRAAAPTAVLAGADLIAQGLEKCHQRLPGVMLFQLDVCDVPFQTRSLDALACINALEHVERDDLALKEFFRVLRPRGLAYIVVPSGPALYDYYDEVLLHYRRYSRGELIQKAAAAGFRVQRMTTLGWSLYPMFWLRKKLNRWRHGSSPIEAKREQVVRDIAGTQDSRVGHLAMVVERAVVGGVSLPFGIRQAALLAKPE